eukprot:SAG31_NODE_244_length_19246_cov_20.233823_17_plen_160_part_00
MAPARSRAFVRFSEWQSVSQRVADARLIILFSCVQRAGHRKTISSRLRLRSGALEIEADERDDAGGFVRLRRRTPNVACAVTAAAQRRRRARAVAPPSTVAEGAEEQRSRGAEEQRSRGAKEWAAAALFAAERFYVLRRTGGVLALRRPELQSRGHQKY